MIVSVSEILSDLINWKPDLTIDVFLITVITNIWSTFTKITSMIHLYQDNLYDPPLPR